MFDDRKMSPDRPAGDSEERAGEDGKVRDRIDLSSEWLEADGLGGFASGTIGGVRTRRYHALLLSARRPPIGRVVLVNGFDAELRTGEERFALSSQRYAPDVTSPDGEERIASFTADPWPTWHYRLSDGLLLRQELFAVRERAATVVRFTLIGSATDAQLFVRPFLSGRDYHSLHHENAGFNFEPSLTGERVAFRPYRDLPEIRFHTNGRYHHEPLWYRNFLYERERDRGLDYVEDLAAPGLFAYDLTEGPAVMILSSELTRLDGPNGGALEQALSLSSREERRRKSYRSPLHRSADAFLVRRGEGATIIAGYPWFTDWGRDTFISLRGLCLAAGRLDIARTILLQWSREVQEGMLPNFFPDADQPPEFNTVDASLWFVVAAYELIERMRRENQPLEPEAEERLWIAIEKVLVGYSEGARYHISVDPGDGLLRAGEDGVQLTWMDAKVGGRVITPRIGKPVEVQALWLNALRIGAARSRRWSAQLDRSRISFDERFWNEERGCLYDVVDVGHHSGQVDASLRPNQLLAVGGLPFSFVSGERARRIVDCAEKHLLTPHGIRTLAPGEHGYVAHYLGGPWARDSAYHQGTAWPWLLGPFVEAWVKVRGGTAEVRAEAYRRFVRPLEEQMFTSAGIGHLSEIADAEDPFTPRGCPFQAWSLGELIRLKLDVLGKR